MHIQFSKIRYKNILSVGNQFIEIDFQDTKTTLISGQNGAGKCVRGSTEVDIEFDDEHTKKLFDEFVKKTANNIELPLSPVINKLKTGDNGNGTTLYNDPRGAPRQGDRDD